MQVLWPLQGCKPVCHILFFLRTSLNKAKNNTYFIILSAKINLAHTGM
jgi:hypothetical protein